MHLVANRLCGVNLPFKFPVLGRSSFQLTRCVLSSTGMEMLAQVTVLVQLRLLVAINSGTTDVRLEACRYKCNVRCALFLDIVVR